MEQEEKLPRRQISITMPALLYRAAKKKSVDLDLTFTTYIETLVASDVAPKQPESCNVTMSCRDSIAEDMTTP